MSGQTIKNILEDVADNIFNVDPYLQQGGDMVRTRGIKYSIDPKKTINNRISNLRLNNDLPIKSNKMYKVSGWASVNNIEEGRPIWEIGTEYLKTIGRYEVDNTKNINVIGEKDNIGIDI